MYAKTSKNQIYQIANKSFKCQDDTISEKCQKQVQSFAIEKFTYYKIDRIELYSYLISWKAIIKIYFI